MAWNGSATTTAMNRLRERPKTLLRFRRGLAALAIIAIAPKCVICVAGYLGLGAVFGLGGPEICGAVNEAGVSRPTTLIVAGACVATGAAGLALRNRFTRARQPRVTGSGISQPGQGAGTEGAIVRTGHRAVSLLPP